MKLSDNKTNFQADEKWLPKGGKFYGTGKTKFTESLKKIGSNKKTK